MEISHYLLHFVKPLLTYPVFVWPLPVWLGGQYINAVKPGYTQHIPTKAVYWTYTFLHLAACTTKYLILPYVSHNKLSISVHMPNGQFGSFPNPHFFVHTDFERFKNLKLEYFHNRPSVMYTALEEEVEEALHDDETTSTSSSLPYLTETDDDDTSPQISTGSPALFQIPPLPPVSNNNANLPFMQTFIANIFIF